MIISLIQGVGIACSCPCMYSAVFIGITNGLVIQYSFAVSSVGRLAFSYANKLCATSTYPVYFFVRKKQDKYLGILWGTVRLAQLSDLLLLLV